MKEIITGITIDEDISLITIGRMDYKIQNICDLFLECAKNDIDIDMISQSAPIGGNIDVSFSISDEDAPKALKIIAGYNKKNTYINSGNIKITFKGEKMKGTTGVAGFVVSLFMEAGADIKMITTSEFEISVLTDAACIIPLKKVFEKEKLI